MRIIFTVLMFLLSFGSVSGQAYFCTDAGTDLVYVRRQKDGKIKWIHTMSIKKNVKSNTSFSTVQYSSSLSNARGKTKTRVPILMEAEIRPDGTVVLDIAASMAAVLKSFLWKNAEVTSEGGRTALPGNMQPGDTLFSARGTVRAAGMSMNVDVFNRRVLRAETIDTPAGRFDCIVVQEDKVEKGMMRNRSTTAVTWYARKIGMVRHDTYRNGHLDTSEVLEEIVR